MVSVWESKARDQNNVLAYPEHEAKLPTGVKNKLALTLHMTPRLVYDKEK